MSPVNVAIPQSRGREFPITATLIDGLILSTAVALELV
jgi:hypothetical protein